MTVVYDNYVWRLQAPSESIDIRLPKDLRFADEFTRNKIGQEIEYSVTGAAILTESIKKSGLPITLQGFDSMGWITRSDLNLLIQLRDIPSLQMKLQFVEFLNNIYGNVHPSYDFDVIFRHSDPPVFDFESVKGFDDFELGNYFKLRSLKFMEANISSMTSPCTANVTLNLASITGTFNIGETVTGGTSGTEGTVLQWDSPNLYLHVDSGTFNTGETVTGPSGSGIVQ